MQTGNAYWSSFKQGFSARLRRPGSTGHQHGRAEHQSHLHRRSVKEQKSWYRHVSSILAEVQGESTWGHKVQRSSMSQACLLRSAVNLLATRLCLRNA